MSILKNETILNRNQYKITKFIAQGGFGITYLAEEIGYYKHSGFGEEYVAARNPETVVIKELYYNDYCQRDEQTGLITISNLDKKIEFQKLAKNQIDEGKTIRSLNHKNIVRTKDIFQENETAYMVMEYIDCTDLEDILKKEGHLSKEKALKYTLQILDAVDYIHTKIDKKILHLDISPSNILIDNKTDDAILIDFGSALSYDNLQNNITSTTSQIVTGRKKHYSPNEQGDIDNLKSFDATFDTYAVGATLYHLLSGAKPPLSSLVSTGRETITPPSQFGKDSTITEYLDAVVMKSIAPFYKERYSSAQIFEKALKKESEYYTEIRNIEDLINNKKISEAYQHIQSAILNFLATPTLLKIQSDLKQELEKERKEQEYNIFFKKGMNMYNAEEYDLAISYFKNAKDIFPEKAETDEKIKLSKEKLEHIAQEKLKSEQKNLSIQETEEDKTEVLIPSKVSVHENNQDETVLINKPVSNDEPQEKKDISKPISISKPSADPKTNSEKPISNTNTKSSKDKKGIFIGAAALGVIILSGIIYMVSEKKEDKKPIQNITIQTNTPKKSVSKDSNLVTKNSASITNHSTSKTEENKLSENKTITDTKKEKENNNSTEAYDKMLWEKVSNINTTEAYRSYIKDFPNGKFVNQARKMIIDLKKKEIKETITNKIDLAQYNKDLQWAKNMLSVDGCDGCKENETCKSQVTAKLKSALSHNPNGSEAKELLNCLK